MYAFIAFTSLLSALAALAGKPVGLLQVALRDGVPQLSSWSMS